MKTCDGQKLVALTVRHLQKIYVSMKKTSKELPKNFSLETFNGNSKKALLNKIGSLRCEVWQAKKIEITTDLSSGVWFDDDDVSSKHYAVFNDTSVLIASSRLTLLESISSLRQSDWFKNSTKKPEAPFAFISRLVVSPKAQNKGIGRFLDNQCIQDAKVLGAKSVFCDVPEYRINTLKQMGFEVVQEPKNGVVFPTLKWAAMLLNLYEV